MRSSVSYGCSTDRRRPLIIVGAFHQETNGHDPATSRTSRSRSAPTNPGCPTARAALARLVAFIDTENYGMSYVDHCILLSEDYEREAATIHRILFTTPFNYGDYCKATGADPETLNPQWRNRAVDTWAVWTHIHHGGGLFVTSDGNFHKPTKKVKLAQLNGEGRLGHAAPTPASGEWQ